MIIVDVKVVSTGKVVEMETVVAVAEGMVRVREGGMRSSSGYLYLRIGELELNGGEREVEGSLTPVTTVLISTVLILVAVASKTSVYHVSAYSVHAPPDGQTLASTVPVGTPVMILSQGATYVVGTSSTVPLGG